MSDLVKIGHDELHVWSLALDKPPGTISMLAADERDRIAQLRTGDLRRRFLAARTGLRMILGQYLELPPAEIAFAYDPLGKPRLQHAQPRPAADLPPLDRNDSAPQRSDRPIEFNLAHSGELALIAVTSGAPIGIDVEQLRPVKHLEDLARRYFHPAEAAQVLRHASSERLLPFFRCWTRKEAILKTLGTGVQYPLEALQVPLGELVDSWIDVPPWRAVRAGRLWLKSIDAGPGFLAALAGVESKPALKCFRFPS